MQNEFVSWETELYIHRWQNNNWLMLMLTNSISVCKDYFFNMKMFTWKLITSKKFIIHIEKIGKCSVKFTLKIFPNITCSKRILCFYITFILNPKNLFVCDDSKEKGMLYEPWIRQKVIYYIFSWLWYMYYKCASIF